LGGDFLEGTEKVMNKRKQATFRKILERELDRVQATAAGLEEQARMTTGGPDAGSLSNAPMHLGDLGSVVYTQELGSTLLENEGYILRELVDAMRRLNAGTYGTCENCGTDVLEERLKALPYTRYCTECAAKLQSGTPVNFNAGRPQGSTVTLPPGEEAGANSAVVGDQAPFTDLQPEDDSTDQEDVHAVGTAGGGTAVGGLAGTNIGEGEPDNANLEEAMGSGNYDQEIDANDEDTDTYSGPSGGAVGGTPAQKRAVGGTMDHGIAPRTGPGGSSADSGPDSV